MSRRALVLAIALLLTSTTPGGAEPPGGDKDTTPRRGPLSHRRPTTIVGLRPDQRRGEPDPTNVG
jgi:hypothetical protein